MEVGGITYTVDARTDGLLKLEKQVRASTSKVEADLNKVDAAADRVGDSLQQTGAQAEAAGRSMGRTSGIAGQLGFQLQDVAVQAQAGTSAFVILGQQGSQIASSFGPGGAVFGAVLAIASAIGGVLYTSLKNAGGAMQELPAELQAQLDEIKKRFNDVDEASRQAFTQVELGKLNTQFDKQQQIVTNLRNAIALYSKEAGKGNQGAAVAVGQYTLQLKSAEQKLYDIGRLQARVGEELASIGVKGDVANTFNEAQTAAEGMANQLAVAIAKFEKGDLAARRMAAAQALGLTAAEQLPPEIDAALIKLTELEAAERRIAELKREQLEFQREARAELDRELQAELAILDAKSKAKEGIARITVEAGVDAGGAQARVEAEAAKRIAQIQQYAATDKNLAEDAAAAILAVEQSKQEQLTELARRGAEERSRLTLQTTQNTLGAFGDLFGNLAEIASQGGKESFQQWKNLASAQAAISAALAVVNTLANPMIPYPLNIGLAASVGALGAVQIAKIQGQQYSGRLYGGPVQPGGLYPITEDGRPEILQQGNRQYLLPGSRGGKVVSNRDMAQAGGGSGIVINYNPTIYSQDADFEAIMAGQPEAVLNAVRAGLAAEGRTI